MLLIPLLTGCATLLDGPTQNIPVGTVPQGAAVTEENNSALTPATLTLERDRDYLLTITKEGYKTETVKIVHVINATSACNILSFGLIGVAIDSATGACWTLKPDNIIITLRALSPDERYNEHEKLNDSTLKNQLASLQQLQEANLLTKSQYTLLRELMIHCVTNEQA